MKTSARDCKVEKGLKIPKHIPGNIKDAINKHQVDQPGRSSYADVTRGQKEKQQEDSLPTETIAPVDSPPEQPLPSAWKIMKTSPGKKAKQQEDSLPTETIAPVDSPPEQPLPSAPKKMKTSSRDCKVEKGLKIPKHIPGNIKDTINKHQVDQPGRSSYADITRGQKEKQQEDSLPTETIAPVDSPPEQPLPSAWKIMKTSAGNKVEKGLKIPKHTPGNIEDTINKQQVDQPGRSSNESSLKQNPFSLGCSRPSFKRKKRKSNSGPKDVKETPSKKLSHGQQSIRQFSKITEIKEDNKTEIPQDGFHLPKSNPAKVEIIPLEGPPISWYKQRGLNAMSNASRETTQDKKNLIIESGTMEGLVSDSNIKGSLKENINDIVEMTALGASIKQQMHLTAILKVAEHILKYGPVVPTQQLVRVYRETKGQNETSSVRPASFFQTISRHLNLMQVYLNGRAFIVENRGGNVQDVIRSFEGIMENPQKTINKRVQESVGDSFNSILNYLDSKRDRDTVKALLSKITSVNCVMQLSNVQDKRSIARSKDLVFSNLIKFEHMAKELEVDGEENLSEEQKRRKRNRLLQKLKLERLKHIYEGRGRALKCEEFPDLPAILEFAFGDQDRISRAGGGLESHPRLTDTVLYRAADNSTVMRQARETVLALAPKDFNISLSSCFNYTQNYREGTYQARRHHSGKGVNACLSLHKPPRTGVEKLVVNLHWTTQNVNLKLDEAAEDDNNIMVDSKDAKAVVHTDISPVQRPGKSWKKICLPDHDWVRTTTNGIIPMTHLFIETRKVVNTYDNNIDMIIQRSGKAATVLNLAFFEPQTVQRVFNEFFSLLANPSLDSVFRNPVTGKLKEYFVFIVDNGPAEAPSSPAVAMWLVRLARILGLKSIAQKSFAEGHSKRNPVERVHAVHNSALSNEVFSSHSVHEKHEIGDAKHHENMEFAAEEVSKCLRHTSFGGKPCVIMRGTGRSKVLPFNDEENLSTFLGKTERRNDEDDNTYEPCKDSVWSELVMIWDLEESVCGRYREDYQVLNNTYQEEGLRTCWQDKYSTVVYNPDRTTTEELKNINREMQPIPDFIRWLQSGELHYVPLERVRQLNVNSINNTPGAFLPSTILEMLFKVLKIPGEALLPYLSLISWCQIEEVNLFIQNYQKKLDDTFASDKDREYWAQHDLFKDNSKASLQKMAKQRGLLTEGKNTN